MKIALFLLLVSFGSCGLDFPDPDPPNTELELIKYVELCVAFDFNGLCTSSDWHEYTEGSGSEEFDEEMYDAGLEGIIKLFIAGISIGAILGMIFKLRR